MPGQGHNIKGMPRKGDNILNHNTMAKGRKWGFGAPGDADKHGGTGEEKKKKKKKQNGHRQKKRSRGQKGSMEEARKGFQGRFWDYEMGPSQEGRYPTGRQLFK